MKKITKIIILSPLFLAMSSSLTSCSSESSEKFTLKIINSEDYIYLDDEDPSNNMTEQFKSYVKKLAKENPSRYGKYANVEVVYDTSDTNETLYSELQTGKSDYDLINVSDYMAQKMTSEGLIVPLYKDEDGERREDKVPNYETYASRTLRERLDNIEAPIKVKNKETGKTETKYVKLEDYAVGYMWGTLGILFNPEYSMFSKYEKEDVINDMHYSYSALWNPKYHGSISIKNSMRDTFAAGLMNAYESEFAELKSQLDEGEISVEEYLSNYSKLFNGEGEDSFPTVVNKVHDSLNRLKDNIFGLEVDSGKQDIVTGKIGINLAWSGDAVYAMDQAEDTELVGEGNESELYYCVPELGSNLWFDTWVMPKNENRSEERRELALMFLDFMSDPANAMQNMDYTGYTSFIGGEDIVELTRSWYDVRYEDVFEVVDEEEYQVYAYKDEDFFDVSYARCLSTTDKVGCEDYQLYYFEPYTVVDPETEEEIEIETPENVADLLDHGDVVYVKDDEGEATETPKAYGDIEFADEVTSEIDLSYFFNNTFGDDSEYQNDVDTIFYSDSYYADVYPEYDEEGEAIGYYCEDKDGTKHENNSVGRQFFTQYPDEATINRCAVMKDYGENNKLVMKMWEEFKSDPLPTSSLVIFMIIIGAGVGLAAYLLGTKYLVNRIRKKRKGKEQK